MKRNYHTPQIEMIKAQYDAVLLSSDVDLDMSEEG